MPPFSPATKTSAQATPSGYGNFSLTTNIRLRLIENNTPIVPPTSAIIRVLKYGNSAHPISPLLWLFIIISAGNVKITPAANDSPDETAV